MNTMKLPRRKFLHLAAGAAALPAVSRIARAQAYPSPRACRLTARCAGGRRRLEMERQVAVVAGARDHRGHVLINPDDKGGPAFCSTAQRPM